MWGVGKAGRRGEEMYISSDTGTVIESLGQFDGDEGTVTLSIKTMKINAIITILPKPQ